MGITYFVLLEFGLSGVLIVSNVVDFMEFEEEADLARDDDVKNVDVFLVDGEDAIVEFIALTVIDETVEPVS